MLDASALIAALVDEPGAETVLAVLPWASISAVNLAEVVTKLMDRGGTVALVHDSLSAFDLDVVPFDDALAIRAGMLREATRREGLSLGDRACIALAERMGAIALTADRIWQRADLPVRVDLIR